MSGDINVFVVDGYVGADPQISIAPEQKATRARFRIATTRKFQKESGEIVECSAPQRWSTGIVSPAVPT